MSDDVIGLNFGGLINTSVSGAYLISTVGRYRVGIHTGKAEVRKMLATQLVTANRELKAYIAFPPFPCQV